jgi:general secretion pathway protein H
MSVTGIKAARVAIQRGFTLVELLVAMTVAGLVLAVSVPASVRFYQSTQYRAAVRDVISVLTTARNTAVNSGLVQDVAINPRALQLRYGGRVEALPKKLRVTVHSARQLNAQDWGVIRFYPAGGSSGGGVDIESPGGSGVRIAVDWLLGSVTQERYAAD